MPNKGGRYEIRGGKRVLVERTKPAPRPKATAQADAKPDAKPAPKKSSSDVTEKNDG
ncbi:hypothetical protein QWY79_10210 [Halomonas sabkhae]|uniref:hypothetical protein n=1 Tax=Halomonas TaxID=2745 RepID=UPI0025B36285|nr:MULTISPECIES: hypothetical protein [Halomonas]MDN3525637.1 hypothetical protein [Halomonas sabkhae]MDT8895480.1 hypothetical protein [Halomonas sp. I1]